MRKNILALETELARAAMEQGRESRSGEDLQQGRDRALPGFAPEQDWPSYLAEAGAVRQDSYLIVASRVISLAFGKLVQHPAAGTWKAYFRWLPAETTTLPYLSKRFVDADFGFRGTVLRGTRATAALEARHRAASTTASARALGKLYVAKYFPPESKAPDGSAGEQPAGGLSGGH